MSKHQRNSAIELLRIICMLFILIVHSAGASFGLPDIMTLHIAADWQTSTKVLIEVISIIGVNCFVLISGYFGIHASIKGLFNLIYICLFYSLFTFVVASIAHHDNNYPRNLFTALIIYPYTELWFIPAYLLLYIVSPAVNYVISKCSHTLLLTLTALFILINVLFGWGCHLPFNPYGYTITQLIMIYITGRCINICSLPRRLHLNAVIYAYTLSVVLLIISSFIFQSRQAFAYNSPFVILSSVLFFLIFTKINIKSNTINYIASSTLAVYIIHKSPYIWLDYRTAVLSLYNHLTAPLFTIAIIPFIAATFLTCIAIDKIIRISIFTKMKAPRL